MVRQCQPRMLRCSPYMWSGFGVFRTHLLFCLVTLSVFQLA